MTWSLLIDKKAEKDLGWFRKHNKPLYIKCFDLTRETIKEPREGLGKPERLKHFNPEEVYSRRVDQEHRMIYIIWSKLKKIEVIGYKSHYTG
ncbi:type II toxin-antitoxin system YoeB family toxin [bacterium]|nr:type II toxin-antitoxin system YoeB family toxin [bacterium]